MDDRAVILHVEDFAPARFLRSKVLRNAGFEVVEADTADTAMQIAAANSLHLALVDVDLPDGDGFTVCEELKRVYPSLPVLLISAVHVSAWDRDAASTTGAEDYLVEPISSDALVQRVHDALRGIAQGEPETWVVTDDAGIIREASAAAAHMLGITAPHLSRGRRSLMTFFDGDRDLWNHALGVAAEGQIIRRNGLLRPRDRRPISVDVEIAALPAHPLGPSEVRWIFTGTYLS